MKVGKILKTLPDTGGAIVVLSGGMDSTVAMRLAVERYGKKNVRALTFFYGQKQALEIECAKFSSTRLGVKHKVLDLSILGEIGQGFSANLDKNISMPTIKDILGNPRPATYVPNRNMILMSIAAAYAEVENISTIIMGLQATDMYNYHDTTPQFVEKINNVLNENRIIKISVSAPFSFMSKRDEINALIELDGDCNLLANTLTCYNPSHDGKSCGKCPSCSERIKAFIDCKIKDPVKYQIDINWEKYFV